MYFMLTNNSENIEAEAICTSTIAYLLVAPHGPPFILDLRSIWQHLLENGWGKIVLSHPFSLLDTLS